MKHFKRERNMLVLAGCLDLFLGHNFFIAYGENQPMGKPMRF